MRGVIKFKMINFYSSKNLITSNTIKGITIEKSHLQLVNSCSLTGSQLKRGLVLKVDNHFSQRYPETLRQFMTSVHTQINDVDVSPSEVNPSQMLQK